MGEPMTIDDLRACCARCRDAVDRLTDAGIPEPLAVFIADPLMRVDLRDRGWAARFDAEHPMRKADR